MAYEAVVLAGGRSTRMGAVDKSLLHYRGTSLVEHAVRAVAPASTIVVVGPDDVTGSLGRRMPFPVIPALEVPRWGGPAAALAAGVRRLPADAAPWVVVLACDLPRVGEAVPLLVAALAHADDLPNDEVPEGGSRREDRAVDGVLAVDGTGRRQPLLAVYRTRALRDAISSAEDQGGLSGTSLNQLIAPLRLVTVRLDDDLCSDVDTPADAERVGIAVPARHVPAGRTTAD